MRQEVEGCNKGQENNTVGDYIIKVSGLVIVFRSLEERVDVLIAL